MPLTPEDVSRIAHLARLELDPADAAAMLTQLNGFFRIVGQMSAVDTSGVEPLYTPLSAVQDVHLRLREDTITETDQRTLNQRSAPAVEDGLFLFAIVLLWGAALITLSQMKTGAVARFVLGLLAIQVALNAVFDIRVLFMPHGGRSDAETMASLFLIPSEVWAAMWMIASVAMLGWTLWVTRVKRVG